MPTPAAVHTQLTDIVVRVLGCPPEAVVPDAVLKDDLGVDSLTIVEIADELGRRFDLYLSDDVVDELTTVQDAIDAVVHHQEPAHGAPMALSMPPAPEHDPDDRRAMARRFAVWFAVIGVAIGVVFGLGGAAVLNAAGIDDATLPPLVLPTTEPTATPSATPTPTPTPTATETPEDQGEPTLEIDPPQVDPGERFALRGEFPGLEEGTTLQLQVKDPGSDWDDFPVQTDVRDDSGRFATEAYTSRTGEREFRVLHKDSGKFTPGVTVEIG